MFYRRVYLVREVDPLFALFISAITVLGIVGFVLVHLYAHFACDGDCSTAYRPGPPPTAAQIAAHLADDAQAKAEAVAACKTMPLGTANTLMKKNGGFAAWCGQWNLNTSAFIPASDYPVAEQAARASEFADECREQPKWAVLTFKPKAPEKYNTILTCGANGMPSK
jgi:hypothetical protein